MFVLCLFSCKKEVFIEEEPIPSNLTPPVVLPVDCVSLSTNEIPNILQCTLDMCYDNARVEGGEICTQEEEVIHYDIIIYYNTCFHRLIMDKEGRVLQDVIEDCE